MFKLYSLESLLMNGGDNMNIGFEYFVGISLI